MSNIKDQIPYYSLKQASKILNKKFDTEIYNSKSIVLIALAYNLKLHVYFYGHWMISCYAESSVCNNQTQEKQFSINSRVGRELISIVVHGVLLELDVNAIRSIHNKGEFFHENELGFCGALEVHFESKSDEYYSFLSGILNLKDLALENEQKVGNIDQLQIPIICPYMIDIDDEDFKPPVYQYFDDDGRYSYFPHIRLKDIVITHTQLQKIIDGELILKSDDYLGDKTSKYEKHISLNHSSRGISQSKRNAKLASQTLADYFWRQDTEQKIRIKEMAIQVYADLNQTQHADQLPDKTESLQSWIEPIADKYPHSRKPGRPENGD
ncbi:hypothetical protein SAMN05421749_10314 [Acinetobacter marinus]|uniref:Uncharacterized protein n=1 Tax=Acinetobacter marinus TaxID=281375 RepID=A0A1G6IER3_9GAMM|nr:hypothetical protein [Acinetobacter marinus]SDC04900.1 hypothetical protein SAMN05421749_10314 [Acinetobacter marinus]